MAGEHPTVRLEPRHYQDLIDEAKLRAGQHCPEWTDHNVSDPGVTLIEQFAWMTDILLYRVNQLPEKVHSALLDLIGIQLEAAVAATVTLRFMLSKPPAAPVLIPATTTEVATAPDDDRPAVVFQVVEDATIPVIGLAQAAVMRSGVLTAMTVSDGIARPLAGDREAFSAVPAADDALYLGFAESPAGAVLQVHVSATVAGGAGIDPDTPPWVWECSYGGGRWEHRPDENEEPVEVLSEGTGGFNYALGFTEIQVPDGCAQDSLGGLSMYWVRCRLLAPPSTDAGELATPRFVDSPLLENVHVNAIGVLAQAHHAKIVENEEIGTSDGTANQRFKLRHAPTLALWRGEALEVSDRRGENWQQWHLVDSFVDSDRDDQGVAYPEHYQYMRRTGEVQLAPAIREPTGWHRHGAIPPKGAKLRMTRYRYGGGDHGNVAANTLTILRTPIPGIARVTNPRKARGGRDPETLAAAQHRAADELRTRSLAITREDFEQLAMNSNSQVARTRCEASKLGETVHVHLLRHAPKDSVNDPANPIAVEDLIPPKDLRDDVKQMLERRTLLGTSVHVSPVALRGVTVAVEVQVASHASRTSVRREILRQLYRYLNPLIGGRIDGDGRGWKWGAPLTEGELRMLVNRVARVEKILLLRIYETDIESGRPHAAPVRGQLDIDDDELIVSFTHAVKAIREGER